ncbi:hypothetical protein IKM56_04795 [Candidatus Saccharibacteria bacterium]|nr:hypothetical protein [Candidatus Saccharibacteria bacterium]
MSEKSQKNTKKKTEKKAEKVEIIDVVRAAEEPEESEFSFHWYHFVALGAVAVLMVVAGSVLLHRYDPSLIGSSRMLRISYGCTEGDVKDSFRYFGINDGDLFMANSKDIKRVYNADEAVLELVRIDGKPSIKIKQDGEWIDDQIEFGEDGTYVLDSNAECKPGIKIQLSI